MDPATTEASLLWKALSGASLLLSGIVGWITVHTIQRVDDLKENAVMKDELHLLLTQLREDRLNMHRDNQAAFSRLETRLETLHSTSDDRRHALSNRVQELSLAIGQLIRESPRI